MQMKVEKMSGADPAEETGLRSALCFVLSIAFIDTVVLIWEYNLAYAVIAGKI